MGIVGTRLVGQAFLSAVTPYKQLADTNVCPTRSLSKRFHIEELISGMQETCGRVGVVVRRPRHNKTTTQQGRGTERQQRESTTQQGTKFVQEGVSRVWMNEFQVGGIRVSAEHTAIVIDALVRCEQYGKHLD